MLPFRSSVRGTAPVPTSGTLYFLGDNVIADYKDIVDEALDLFRGNVYFANFEIKGPADRLLCLKDIEKCKTAEEATRALYLTNAKKMHTPGSPGYSLNRLLFPPKNEQEKTMYHAYMDQIRIELSKRLVERVYREGDWSRKWWMTFLKRDFMNLELTLVYVCFLNKRYAK
ncbi:hypothetical protein JH06_2431 [Blastocystis sp. subtype 4]|uniref:hypothetical protein n=1 Tax=Blastocystis sp. subtype 4 TaxID=944170 RepID=UPI00071224CF|nr:hypothetical protein JH06_2431 [Blastocystis sp. subtype 4]KNB45571.1 hypothetical protein JH06_2431 [Blastocystis sp. subtype 4]|eukprot:XP_014529002.1 hypothetical protein JH06_2431 [Blastocystis sp. subtype 4]